MRKIYLLLSIFAIIALLTPTSAALAKDNGVDDLRGRWDVNLYGDYFPPSVILYINDIQENPYSPDMYLAGGCMRSPDSDAFMPLSLAAISDPESGTYEVTIYSTVVEPEGWAYVIRLEGQVTVNGKGVPDDVAEGTVTTEFGTGGWSGIHHDRRRTKCPSIGDFDFGVQADVYAHKDLAYATPKHYTLYETHTVVVSSGMLVEVPDGSTMIVQEYTDIFSPDVDFIGRFRYLTHFEDIPISAGTYKFVLLDVFGNPIPGTESTDVWAGCNQIAPINLMTSEAPDGDILLKWDVVPDVPGQFEPGAEPQIGFYQIGVSPYNWEGEQNYGANGIKSPSHDIPMHPFIPGDPGQPDGWDFGETVSGFEDGLYQVNSEAFGQPFPDFGGFGHECSVYNSAEQLLMRKQDGLLSFEKIATISGNVSGLDGALANVHVDACDWDDTFCTGAETDENGDYIIFGLPSGDYRVSVWGGQGGWIDEYYFETPFHHEATPVTVTAGSAISGIDFTMEFGGSISGTVFYIDGNPLGGIAVDTEEGGYGICTDGDGFYSLDGLPLGEQVNVVAGRDFCDEHPFEEQIQFEVPVGSGDVDFYLNVASNYYPTLHVVPAHPEIHGHEWNPDATVTIYVDDDDDLDNGFIYTESKLVTDEPTWCIEPCFDVSLVPELPDGILPGYVVTMMDDEATRIVHTTNLAWTGADTDADTVFGTAEPGTWIEVTAHGPQWGQRMVQATEDGNWVADFSVPGVEDFEQDVLDLEPGYHGRSIQFEESVPDDGTLAYWHIEEPVQPDFTIIAHPDHEWVSSHGWVVGAEITLYLDDNDDPSDGYNIMLTQITTPADWDPSIGWVWFDNWAPFDLTPGMFAIVSDGLLTETLLVESFAVDFFDETADTVSGMAPSNRDVGVGVHQPDGDFWLVVMSDSSGYWSADFGAEGIDMLDVFDIHAMIWDEDGDATQTNYIFP